MLVPAVTVSAWALISALTRPIISETMSFIF
jgi:hypothetical protein